MKNKQPIKVAWILHGAYLNEGRVYKESQTLANAGYEVRIFAIWENGLPLLQRDGKVTIERISFPLLCKCGPLLYHPFLFMPFYTIRMLFRILYFKPAVIHCMNFWTLHVGWLSFKIFRLPYVYDSHDLFIGQNLFNGKPKLVKLFYKNLERFFAARAALVLQADNARKEYFEKIYGIKAEVISNKAVLIKEKGGIADRPEKLLLEKQKVELLYVGALMPNRGIEQILDATADMKNVQVCLLGRSVGNYQNALLKKYKERALFIPPMDPKEVVAYIRRFDLGVSLIQNSCLSYYLCCPTKVYELLVAGVPQLASDFPEIRKVIVDNPVGPVGRVVDPSNCEQIRKNLEEMLSNPQELQVYQENSRRFRETCNWEEEAKKLKFLYCGILN